MAALNATGNADFSIGPPDGTEDEPLAGRFLETRFRLRDRGIFFQRGLQKFFQRHPLRVGQDRQERSTTERES